MTRFLHSHSSDGRPPRFTSFLPKRHQPLTSDTAESASKFVLAYLAIDAHAISRKIAEKDTSFASPAYGASTGNSTLRNHLKRQHPKKYEKLLQIESADDPKSSLNQLFQTTIDNHLQPNIDQPRYTAAGLALACLKLISACDLVRVLSLNLAPGIRLMNRQPSQSRLWNSRNFVILFCSSSRRSTPTISLAGRR